MKRMLSLLICAILISNSANGSTINSYELCQALTKEYSSDSTIEGKIIQLLPTELCIQLSDGTQITVILDENDKTRKDYSLLFKNGAHIAFSIVSIDADNGIIVISPKSEEIRQIIVLENEVLRIVDGNALAINGTTIGMMLHLRSELGKRRNGIKQDGKLVGFYTFLGKKYTMAELVRLETEWNTNQTKENKDKVAQLYTYMQNFIKDEFLKLTAPFLADARGAKGQMVILITEWAQKAHRINSHLLQWSHTKESDEASALKSQIRTLKDFDQFCVDLVNFLESLMRSCPKACQQFKEILEQKQKEKQNQHK